MHGRELLQSVRKSEREKYQVLRHSGTLGATKIERSVAESVPGIHPLQRLPSQAGERG